MQKIPWLSRSNAENYFQWYLLPWKCCYEKRKRVHSYTSVIFAIKYTNPHSHFNQSQPLTVLTNLHLGRVQSQQLASTPFSIKWGNTRARTDFKAGGLNSSEGLLLMHLMVVGCQLGRQLKLSVRTFICGPATRLFGFLTVWRLGLHEQVSQKTGSGAASYIRLRPGDWYSHKAQIQRERT